MYREFDKVTILLNTYTSHHVAIFTGKYLCLLLPRIVASPHVNIITSKTINGINTKISCIFKWNQSVIWHEALKDTSNTLSK